MPGKTALRNNPGEKYGLRIEVEVGVRRLGPRISLTRAFAAAFDNPRDFDLTQYRACALWYL